MYKYEIGFILSHCPKPWKNLIQANQTDPGKPVERDTILKLLEPYNLVKYDPHGSVLPELYYLPYLIFETEEDAMAFVLRYS